MSEKNTWRNLRKRMVPTYWAEATRHEDKYQRGIADVSFVQRRYGFDGPSPAAGHADHGWMELKHRSRAPVRRTTVLRLDHYSDDQRIWLRMKGEAGGMTFLLLQLERDYLLFDHVQCQAVGKVTTEQTYAAANWVSHGKLDAHGLWHAINEFG